MGYGSLTPSDTRQLLIDLMSFDKQRNYSSAIGSDIYFLIELMCRIYGLPIGGVNNSPPEGYKHTYSLHFISGNPTYPDDIPLSRHNPEAAKVINRPMMFNEKHKQVITKAYQSYGTDDLNQDEVLLTFLIWLAAEPAFNIQTKPKELRELIAYALSLDSKQRLTDGQYSKLYDLLQKVATSDATTVWYHAAYKRAKVIKLIKSYKLELNNKAISLANRIEDLEMKTRVAEQELYLVRAKLYVHDEESELYQKYSEILDLPSIRNFTIRDNEIALTLKTYMNIYDEFAAEIVHNNCKYPKAAKFLKDLYIDKQVGHIVRQDFRINLNTLSITIDKVDENEYRINENPHISYFNCWKSYRSKAMQNLAETNDLLSTILILQTALASINFSDATVINWWLSKLEAQL